MLRIISVICAAGALIVPVATASASTASPPANQLACQFIHGSSDGPATTACFATTFSLNQWVTFCLPDAASSTGFEQFNIALYDTLETDSVYAGNATSGPADGSGFFHELKPQARLLSSNSVPDQFEDSDHPVDLGTSCTP